jgi:hypothetical protein
MMPIATTPPTTLAGVVAVLRLANLIEDEGCEWPDTDAIGPDGWHYELKATMAAAIEAIIRQKAGALMRKGSTTKKPSRETIDTGDAS